MDLEMAIPTSRCRIVLVTLVLVAPGCARSGVLSASIQTTPPAPASWGTAAEGTTADVSDLSLWWERLGDGTLTDLINTTLRANPDVRVAAARLRQARAQRGIAAASLLPSVSLSGSASDRNDSNSALSIDLDASWEPDVFGGTRASVAAALADLRASAADLYAAQISLAAEVARNYVDLRTQQTRLDIARRNEATQAETLELAEFRAQAGLVSGVDVEQARTNVEQTRAQLPTLESSIAQTMHRLATLAGLEPAGLRDRLRPVSAFPSIPSAIAIGIPASTLRQRPDVRAAEQRVLAEDARVRQAKTQRLPQLSLSGSLGTQFVRRGLSASSELATAALSGGASLVSSLAASAFQTLFDGGRIRQQIAVQTAAQEQAAALYEATILTALEDVENALVSFERTRERLAALTRAATAANNAAALASTQYQAGLADFQRVLDTQRTALSVEDSLAQTQGDRVTALVQLYKALGGGWSPATATDLP
jgi:outer membrane protein, multidrug efflux system